jgi:UDP-3-O-[3-hydroxymyristoyl] glucosamine N-acyltransferase
MNNSININYAMIKDILAEHQIVGNKDLISFSNIKSINNADSNSLVFIHKDRIDKQKIASSTKAKLIIIDSINDLNEELISSKIFIIVNNPKLIFSKIGNKYFNPIINYSIHPSVVIHSEAKISSKVYIGPNCVIGKGVIEDGTIIYGNVFIYDNFRIGKNVKINAGSVIGAEGFGYNKDEYGIPIQFPHIGGVTIEDDVEIGTNTSIDRGALSDTIIRKGAKIDNLVHIAHNVVIGENAYIIANAMIAGSSKIGDNAYIAPSASVKDQLTIGNNSLIGMSASVLKNVPHNEIWTGSPAQSLEKIKLLNEKLKKL